MQVIDGLDSQAKLNSSLIYDNLKTVETAHLAYLQSINEISEDIRCIERILKEKKIHVEFTYQTSHVADAGCFAYTALIWRKHDSEYRLFYTSAVGSWNDQNVDTKPLIECKVDVRIHIYPELSNFLTAFAEHLSQAKVAREKEMEAETLALFGL